MARFIGFSTKNKSAINHTLTGRELVVEDLMNHIMTRKGERVMMPTYGSIIHDMIFEPLTAETITLIKEDLTGIVNDDPRVELDSINVSDSEHQINASVRVNILPTKEPVTLEIDLQRE
jgi:phage baseplate assembly protein W|tara:strand:+ start:212 stop:568 length:357 start_codon:yes stop_codon:yes gene_type:complete